MTENQRYAQDLAEFLRAQAGYLTSCAQVLESGAPYRIFGVEVTAREYAMACAGLTECGFRAWGLIEKA